MLVLSRKVNEKIVIDGGIVVTVVKIEGGQVRLGIEAPSKYQGLPGRDCGQGSTYSSSRSPGWGGRLSGSCSPRKVPCVGTALATLAARTVAVNDAQLGASNHAPAHGNLHANPT